jgi:carbonic anhydrase
MEKLVRGVEAFQQNYLSSYRELFEKFIHGQAPEALFITCSDSRINPNLITQTEPGEMFILRNAGNLIPPFGATSGGEGASIEYAVVALGIKDIIVCGHSHCGAMGGLLYPENLEGMPLVEGWLKHAEATRQIMAQNYQDLEGDPLLMATVEENVLVQLDNLRTYPCVAVRLARGALRIHGWVYEVQTGEVFAYEAEKGQFVPLREASPMPTISRRLARQTSP